MFWLPIIEKEVETLISRLSSSKTLGYDMISAKLIKRTSIHLVPVQTVLFNKSLLGGKFPDSLKIAKIIPIPKKRYPLKIENYRPISLLSIFSKIFEKLVKSPLLYFLNSTHFLSNSQFGFREGLNTELALRRFMQEIYIFINSKKIKRVSGLFLDINKAFETVNHQLLLGKLNAARVRGLALQWFQSYLTDRWQVVKIMQRS